MAATRLAGCGDPSGNRRQFGPSFVLAISLLAVGSSSLGAQDAKFDMNRFRSNGDRWKPFRVEETQSLKDALTHGQLTGETRILVMELPAGRLALVEDQMAYHHAAQGDIDGEPWLVSY